MTRGLTRDCGARATIGLSPGPPSDVCRISADSQPKYVTRLWSCAAHARPVHPRCLPFQRRGRPADRSVRRHRRPQRSRPYGLSSFVGGAVSGVLWGSAPAYEVRGLTVEEWPRRGPQSWGADRGAGYEFVALDVHVSGTVAAIIDRDSGELGWLRLSGRSSVVCGLVAAMPGPVCATYEAGPTGFALTRRLEAAGVDCLVCAAGLIVRGPSDRVTPIGAMPSGWCGC